MTPLEEYYNKFNEDKRLLSRHGQVEFNTTLHYIRETISLYKDMRADIKIADIGAGTGRYSLLLAKEGYDVTAVELVKYNLGILKKHAREELPENAKLTAIQGNAVKLKKLPDESFDVTLLLGPMYHLHNEEDKLRALSEARRITKPGGRIFTAYVMSDYAVIKYGFMEGNILDSITAGKLDEEYRIKSDENELYEYVRMEDINRLNEKTGLKRERIIAPDGAADYIRPYLNSMSEEAFNTFLDYQIKNSARAELLGASSHLVDILIKE